MAIRRLCVGNFKGIATSQWLDIKPITVFIGANSSGKSTCIHALACLSQTVKVTNNSRPLILDDEFASVHLGRFIDVIHSKSYRDVMGLGVGIEDVNVLDFESKKKRGRTFALKSVSANASYNLKCTLRTQDVAPCRRARTTSRTT